MTKNITALQIVAQAEAACYSLPYGGIGFASHIISYYTMVMLFFGRQPLPPFRPLRRQLWSSMLGLAKLIATIVLSAIAMHRCQNHWPFMVLAVWMLTTSICLSVLTVVSPLVFSRDAERNRGVSAVKQWEVVQDKSVRRQTEAMNHLRTRSTHWSQDNTQDGLTTEVNHLDKKPLQQTVSGQICIAIILLWLCGCIMGVVAIYAITMTQYETRGPLFIETTVFGSIVTLGLGLILLKYMYGLFWLIRVSNFVLLASIPVNICVFGLLWMDWTLGIATGNLSGSPSPDAKFLYWTYFAVKRLGLLSM